MLPRLDRRRGLVNVAGSIFKTLFGVATVIDLDKLHDAVNKLHDTQSDLVHSVNEQLTCLRSLDSLVKFNSKSVKSLSEKVKSMTLNSQQWMNTMDAKVHWLNATLNNQTSVFVYIRQLEFETL
jgi:tetrahydromethanopterin S-methyltransferase subunit B